MAFVSTANAQNQPKYNAPAVYLDGILNGGTCSKQAKEFIVKTKLSSENNHCFIQSIQMWGSDLQKCYHGPGSKLTQEMSVCLNSLTPGDKIHFLLKIRCSSGMAWQTTAVYTLQ